MKLERAYSLKEIAKFLNCSFVGDENHSITGLNEIHRVEAGDIVFVDHPKYYDKALNSNATTILIDKEVDCPEGKGLLVSENPFDDFNKLTRHFSPNLFQESNIGENSQIDPSVQIFPNVFVGRNCTIEKNVVLHPGCVIGDNSIIEEGAIIGSNSVIGHYAFYYKKKDGEYNRMHTCGNVIIKKNAEIGALCTIDAGVTSPTIIGEGTKLDNQVHIGHDTIVGKNCLMAANVGVAGCVQIEDNVTLWGQVGVVSDVTIGQGAVVLGQSGVGRDLTPNKTYLGSPCEDARVKWREMAAAKKLPSIMEKL